MLLSLSTRSRRGFSELWGYLLGVLVLRGSYHFGGTISGVNSCIVNLQERLRQEAVAKYFPPLAVAISNTMMYVTRTPMKNSETANHIEQLAKSCFKGSQHNVNPFLIIVYNFASLGDECKPGEDGRDLDRNHTKTFVARHRQILSSVFKDVHVVTLPNQKLDNTTEGLKGAEVFLDKIDYLTELLTSHQQQSHDLRAQQGLALPARALLTVLPKLVHQSVNGETPSLGAALKSYMKDHPDEDQKLLKYVFEDIQTIYSRTCGANSHSLKSVRSKSINVSMRMASRYLAFKFVCQGVQDFPKPLQDKRAEGLYEKLLVYVKALYCKCSAESAEHGVVCGRDYLDHDNKHRPVVAMDEADESFWSWLSSFFKGDRCWDGDFQLSTEDNAHLNQKLKEDMKQHTHATARLWKATERRTVEERFDQFRKQGIDLLVQYARSIYKDLGMHVLPKKASRTSTQLQEKPAEPFCVACCQQVQCEIQSFVLCTICHMDYERALLGSLPSSTLSGPQVYAIGQDGLIYQQFMDRLGVQKSWPLHVASWKAADPSSRFISIAASSWGCRALFAVTRHGSLQRLALQDLELHEHPSQIVWTPVSLPATVKARAVAILEFGDLAKIFVVSESGHLYVKGLQELAAPPLSDGSRDAHDSDLSWQCLTPSRTSYLRCITFASGTAYAFFSRMGMQKRNIYRMPVSDLMGEEFKRAQWPDRFWKWHAHGPSEKLRAIAATSTHFYAISGDKRVCRICNDVLENSADSVHTWQVVSPDLSNFASIAVGQEGETEASLEASDIATEEGEPDPYEDDDEDEAGASEEVESPDYLDSLDSQAGQTLADLALPRSLELAAQDFEASEPDVDGEHSEHGERSEHGEVQVGVFQNLADRAMDAVRWELPELRGLMRLGALGPLEPQGDQGDHVPLSPALDEEGGAQGGGAQGGGAQGGGARAGARENPDPSALPGAPGELQLRQIFLCIAAGAVVPPALLLVLFQGLGSADPAITAMPLLLATSQERHMLFHHKMVCLMGWLLQMLVMFRPSCSFAISLALLFNAIIGVSKVSRDPLHDLVRLCDRIWQLVSHLRLVPSNVIALLQSTALFASLIYSFQHKGAAIPWTMFGCVVSALVASQCISMWSYLEVASLQVVLNTVLLSLHSTLFGMETQQRLEYTSATIILIHCVALLMRGSLYFEKKNFEATETCWVMLAQALFWMFAAFLNKRHIRAALVEIMAAVEGPEDEAPEPRRPGPMEGQAMNGLAPPEGAGERLRRRVVSLARAPACFQKGPESSVMSSSERLDKISLGDSKKQDVLTREFGI